MSKGFFSAPADMVEDLTQVPGKKELVKPPTKKKEYNCNECGLCAHSLIKVKDEEESTPEIKDENGTVIQKEEIKYKHIPKGGREALGVQGEGQKKILIIADELTENGYEAQKSVIGQERRLLKNALKEVGINLDKDCWLVNSVRGVKEGYNKATSGLSRKACGRVLREDIKRLKPNVIITCGFSPTYSLLSHKLSITDKWEIFESYTIPDQEFMSHVIVTFSTRDFIRELKNRQARYKEWKKEKVKKGQTVPKYYEDALDRETPLANNPILRSDDFKVKWDRFIKALDSANKHWDKPVPKDDAYDLVEILKDKKEILDVIKYFHTVKCVSNDVEATSLKFQRPEADIVCISLSDGIRNVAYMTYDQEIIEATAKLIADPKVLKVAHNAPYEISAYKSKWDVWMEHLYVDSQLLAHAWDHRGEASKLKNQTYFWFGNAGYGDKMKPFFKMRDADKGTKYVKSNQTINKIPEALERGKLYEAGLLFPLEENKSYTKERLKAIVDENKRREKELKKGYLTEDELLEYNCLDSIYTTKLVRAIVPKLMNKREFDAVRFSTEGAVTLAKMTYNGLQTDQEKLQANIDELEKEIKDLHDQIISCDEALKWDGGKDGKTTFNYNSGQQLARLLFDILQYTPGKKTAKGAYATDKSTLEKVGSPICKLILEKKALAKVVDTYLRGYKRESDDEGIVKCNFPLGLTLSWRSSANSCNFQNSPKHSPRLSKLSRSFMGPHKGQIWKEYDFSAAENYTASIISGDMELLRYNSDPTTDLHGDTAVDIFKIDDRENLPAYEIDGVLTEAPEGMWKRLRQTGKLFVFPAFFGSNYIGITDSIWEAIANFTAEQKAWLEAHFLAHGIRSKEAFKEIVKEAEYQFWQVRFKAYYKYKQDIWKKFVKQGYLQTPVGHVLRSVHNRRTASSYSIQGGSFEKLLCGLIIAQKEFERLNLKSKLVGEVHDSVCVSVEPSEEEIVDKIITLALIKGTDNHPLFDWVTLDFVLDCDIYTEGNWGSKPTEKRMNPADYDKNYITA